MEYDSDSDISWLTQTPSLEKSQANFNVDYEYIEENIDLCNVVSLEDNGNDVVPSTSRVLYDNVVVEDIPSDEKIDTM